MIRPTPSGTRSGVPACLAGLCLVLVGGVAQSDDSAGQRGWYGGLGGGISQLTPDTDGSALTLDDESSALVLGWVGRDIGRRFSIEAALSDLGEASLGNASIGYRAASLGLVGHVLGNSERIASRSGASLYLRGGLSLMENDSELDLDEADNTAIWAGLGVDWPVMRSFGLRGEVTSYDGDARGAWLGIYARLRSGGDAVRRPPVATPRDRSGSQQDTPTRTVPDVAATPEPRTLPRPKPAPRQSPDVARVPDAAPRSSAGAATALSSECVEARGGEPLDQRGCALFAGTLDEVAFLAATDRMTPKGERSLEVLAQALLRNPDTTVEIRAHVAPMLTEAVALRLSRERALAVAKRLVGAGVPVAQLRARAFGDRQPLPAGDRRRDSNRIEIGIAR